MIQILILAYVIFLLASPSRPFLISYCYVSSTISLTQIATYHPKQLKVNIREWSFFFLVHNESVYRSICMNVALRGWKIQRRVTGVGGGRVDGDSGRG